MRDSGSDAGASDARLGARRTDRDWERGSEATVVDPDAASEPSLPDAPRLEPGSRLGRYEVIDLLGHGGMGAVYRAYDPELDRTVALKLLLMGGRSERARARLQREAQAIARLSHPNVVQVFDVGRRDQAGGVFIAMEFVDGPTLKQWLKREKREWREIAKVFADAGEGLLAAHQRGLVHRDFKPDNVLLDEHARAKVVDFGLAKGSESLAETHSIDLASVPSVDGSAATSGLKTSGSRKPLAEITQLGSRIGTPAYMPPEQIHGGHSDPRADQFSFAVALYEALFGRLPFDGTTPESYALNVLEGAVHPIPRSSDVPTRLQNGILRALAVSPSKRFASLAPLLEILRDDPARRRRRWLALTGATAAGVAISTMFLPLWRPETPAADPCAQVARAMSALWSEERRGGVASALAAVPRSFAADASARAIEGLDEVAESWSSATMSTCRGDIEQRADTSTLHAAKNLCLDRSLSRFRNLVDALESPTPESLAASNAAIGKLSFELQACSDPSYLQGMLEAGTDPMSEELARVDQRLLEIEQAQDLALYERSQRALDELGRPDAGQWPAPILLRWGITRSVQALATGDSEAALRDLEYARDLSLGEPAPLEALNWASHRVAALQYEGDIERSDAAARIAAAMAEGRFGRTHRLSISAAKDLGIAPYERGDYAKALQIFREAAERARRHLSAEDEVLLDLHSHLGSTLAHLQRHDEAIELLASVVQTRTRVDGASHPYRLDALHALANAYLRAKRLPEAKAAFAEELQLTRRDLDVVNPLDEAGVIANLAATLLQMYEGEPQREYLIEAEGLLREALDGARDSMSERSARLAIAPIRSLLGLSLTRQGRHREAVEALDEALAIFVESEREATANGLMTRLNLVRALHASEDLNRARAQLAEAERLATQSDNRAMLDKLAKVRSELAL